MSPIEKKKVLVEYLKMKVFDEDWHGVSDAANELREVEIKIKSNNYKAADILRDGLKDNLVRPNHPEHQLAGLSEWVETPGPVESSTIINKHPQFNQEATERVQKVMDMLKRGDEELANLIFPDGAL